MKKTEAKEIARNIIQDAIAVAYYKVEDENYTEEEKELIYKCIEEQAKKILKTINRDYITY